MSSSSEAGGPSSRPRRGTSSSGAAAGSGSSGKLDRARLRQVQVAIERDRHLPEEDIRALSPGASSSSSNGAAPPVPDAEDSEEHGEPVEVVPPAHASVLEPRQPASAEMNASVRNRPALHPEEEEEEDEVDSDVNHDDEESGSDAREEEYSADEAEEVVDEPLFFRSAAVAKSVTAFAPHSMEHPPHRLAVPFGRKHLLSTAAATVMPALSTLPSDAAGRAIGAAAVTRIRVGAEVAKTIFAARPSEAYIEVPMLSQRGRLALTEATKEWNTSLSATVLRVSNAIDGLEAVAPAIERVLEALLRVGEGDFDSDATELEAYRAVVRMLELDNDRFARMASVVSSSGNSVYPVREVSADFAAARQLPFSRDAPPDIVDGVVSFTALARDGITALFHQHNERFLKVLMQQISPDIKLPEPGKEAAPSVSVLSFLPTGSAAAAAVASAGEALQRARALEAGRRIIRSHGLPQDSKSTDNADGAEATPRAARSRNRGKQQARSSGSTRATSRGATRRRDPSPRRAPPGEQSDREGAPAPAPNGKRGGPLPRHMGGGPK